MIYNFVWTLYNRCYIFLRILLKEILIFLDHRVELSFSSKR